MLNGNQPAKQGAALLFKLDEAERETIAEMDVDTMGHANDVDAAWITVPPGEEGFDISHEGREYEVFEDLANEIENTTGRRRVDDRIRHDRHERRNQHWAMQVNLLVKSYLEYQSRQDCDGLCSPEAKEEDQADLEEPDLEADLDAGHAHGADTNDTEDTEQGHSSGAASTIRFDIIAIDMFVRKRLSFSYSAEDKYPNEVLLRNGYLGCAPLRPTVAVSLRTLTAFRQMHRACPRFSVDAMCKALCHLHNVPFRNYLQTQFSIAYDMYLEICRRIDEEIQAALGTNGTPARARLEQLCPACFYSVPGEPALEFSVMVSMDGNNSLKRVGASFRGHGKERSDNRTIQTMRWLPREFVDKFGNDVDSAEDSNDSNVAQDQQHTLLDDGPSLDGLSCADRWRNAGPEQHKRMFALFDETGIFITTCRHRIVLYACDMVKSGELAKYPLVMVNRLMEDVGSKIGCAYDIGCAFSKTLANSSLGERAKELEFRMMVGAFHGHAHNRGCQLQWHPLYMTGTGHSEGEGCEHVFSASNDVARGTRYASRFHRHQAIEEHFSFWDQDKYALLSQYLARHYKEAKKAIVTLEAELYILSNELGCVGEDQFKQYLTAEKEHFAHLEQTSPLIQTKVKYVQSLKKLKKAHDEWEKARASVNTVYTSVPTPRLIATITETRLRVEAAYERLEQSGKLVSGYELMLGISVSERWTETTPEYQEYEKQGVKLKYKKAIDELERLVVMRLFELSKMNASGTGYKLRRYICKALQRRSEAIRNAISRYNTLAAQLSPKRSPVSWKEIADYSFLAEFDLLRFTDADIRDKLWARPAHREATTKYFRLLRAHEEIERLNVEISRLFAFIEDEKVEYAKAIKKLSIENPNLAVLLKRKWALRSSVNDLHVRRLAQIKTELQNKGKLYEKSESAIDEDIDLEIEQNREAEEVADFIIGIDA